MTKYDGIVKMEDKYQKKCFTCKDLKCKEFQEKRLNKKYQSYQKEFGKG